MSLVTNIKDKGKEIAARNFIRGLIGDADMPAELQEAVQTMLGAQFDTLKHENVTMKAVVSSLLQTDLSVKAHIVQVTDGNGRDRILIFV